MAQKKKRSVPFQAAIIAQVCLPFPKPKQNATIKKLTSGTFLADTALRGYIINHASIKSFHCTNTKISPLSIVRAHNCKSKHSLGPLHRRQVLLEVQQPHRKSTSTRRSSDIHCGPIAETTQRILEVVEVHHLTCVPARQEVGIRNGRGATDGGVCKEKYVQSEKRK